jgi:TolB-like protein/Tfp pilus assembly protein PilF
MNIESNTRAKQLAQEAIDLDPEYAMAYRALAAGHRMDVYLGASKSPKQSMGTCRKLLEKAIELDPNYAEALAALGFTYSGMGKHDKAVATAERAVALDPNAADIHTLYAHTLRFANRPEEAIPEYKKAIRLNPIPPGYYLFGLGMSYSLAGQHQEAIKWCEKSVRQDPDSFMANLILTAVYSMAGRDEDARAQAEEVLRLNPKYHLERSRKRATARYKDKWFAALSKAGLPEHPPLPLPDKPSIAVLAFDNLSGDPEQEYFSDGLSEEIISALSKTDQLFVIARNSSFVYKGKPVNVKQISRELGVRYVLEGSVRKSEDRVRITAQLIDATTGHHLWSERYDRELKDIFAVQDDVTMKIITALQVKLTEGEQIRIWAKQWERLDVLLKNMELLSLWRNGSQESFMRIGQVAQEVVDMAPELTVGYLHLGLYHYYLARAGVSPRESMKKSFKFAQKALSLDESDGGAHALLGKVYTRMRQHEKGIAAGKRSIELDPNRAEAHVNLGWTLIYSGRPDEAIEYFNKAIRLNPFPPFHYYEGMGFAYLIKGNYEKAITEFKKALQLAPMSSATLAKLAVAYGLLGREEEARASAEKVLELAPVISVSFTAKTVPFKNQTDLELLLNGMRKAGFPE